MVYCTRVVPEIRSFSLPKAPEIFHMHPLNSLPRFFARFVATAAVWLATIRTFLEIKSREIIRRDDGTFWILVLAADLFMPVRL